MANRPLLSFFKMAQSLSRKMAIPRAFLYWSTGSKLSLNSRWESYRINERSLESGTHPCFEPSPPTSSSASVYTPACSTRSPVAVDPRTGKLEGGQDHQGNSTARPQGIRTRTGNRRLPPHEEACALYLGSAYATRESPWGVSNRPWPPAAMTTNCRPSIE